MKNLLTLVLLFFVLAIRAEERPLRILPLGDSITRGSFLARYRAGLRKDQLIGLPHPEGGGYRKPLQVKLRAAGIRFDFIGELNYHAYGREGVIDPSFDPDHEGLTGFSNEKIISGGIVPTSPDVLAQLGVESVRASGVVAALEKFQPDVILLLSGANGFDAAARDRLIAMIGEHSRAHLLVGTITTQQAPRKGWEHVKAYNASLPAAVAAQRQHGHAVTLVDVHVVVAPDQLLPDGVHPNQEGLEKIAEAWFQAIQAVARESHQ